MEDRARRLRQKVAFNMPEYFLDDPELLLKSKGRKAADLTRSKGVPAKQPKNVDFSAKKGLGFLDLPAEVRQAIYDYLFENSIFVHGKHAYTGRRTVVRHAICQTCQAIRTEATLSLMTKTKQVFIDIREERNRNWRLHIFHRQYVRQIEVKSSRADNMVWLDMPTLKLCISLEVLELKSFDLSRIHQEPIRTTWGVLRPDGKLNSENDVLISSQLSQIIMERDDPDIPFPMKMSQLRDILRSKQRRFRVMLWISMEIEGPSATNLGATDLFIVKLTLDWDKQSISPKAIVHSEPFW